MCFVTHDEMLDTLPALALNAVSASEADELRAHLEICPTCVELLEAYEETAGMLAASVSPLAPSAGFRERVLQEASATAPATPIIGQVAPSRPRNGEAFGRKAMALVSSAAVLVAAGFSGWMFKQMRAQDEKISETGRLWAVVNSPAVDVVSMAPEGGGGKADGQVFISQASKSTALVLTGLPDPGPRIYALWVITDGRPKPVDEFKPDEKGVALLFVDRPIDDTQTMAVTLEPKEGAKTPQGPVVLTSS